MPSPPWFGHAAFSLLCSGFHGSHTSGAVYIREPSLVVPKSLLRAGGSATAAALQHGGPGGLGGAQGLRGAACSAHTELQGSLASHFAPFSIFMGAEWRWRAGAACRQSRFPPGKLLVCMERKKEGGCSASRRGSAAPHGAVSLSHPTGADSVRGWCRSSCPAQGSGPSSFFPMSLVQAASSSRACK